MVRFVKVARFLGPIVARNACMAIVSSRAKVLPA